MDSGFLILTLCVLYGAAQIHLYKLDLFFAAVFFYLFIYCIFAVAGYVFLPHLSVSISAYFSKEIETPLLVFLILSFLSLYLVLLVAVRYRAPTSSVVIVEQARFNYPAVTTGIILATLIIQVAGFAAFGDKLSYANASDPVFLEEAGLIYRLWFTMFKLSPAVLTVLYATLRYRLWAGANARRLLAFLFISEFMVFIVIAQAVGNRLELVSLFNAVIFVELIRRSSAPRSRSIGFYVGITVTAISCLTYMTWLSRTRAHDPYESFGLLESVIFQDYFAPAHILVAAIGHNLVDLGEVLTSNFMNMLILMNYPYLQQYVTEVFNPGVSSRSTGYAFYIMAEGYLAFGSFGFVYNGLVIGFGLWAWRRIAVTGSGTMNALLLPVLAIDVVNLCRGQSAYFVKNLYFHLVPALMLIFFVTGYYVRGIRVFRHASVTMELRHAGAAPNSGSLQR